jgi:hypothetical protein
VTPGPSRRGGLVAALLLVLLWGAAFHGAFEGRVFYVRDVSQNHEPARRLITERLRAGELPLWDPYHGGGTPLLANPDMLVLHPTTVLGLLFQERLAFTASIVLQFALLLAGGYLLARALPAGRPAALLAAAAFGLSGPALSLSGMQNVLGAFAWLPLVLWGGLRAAREGGARPLLVAAPALAVILATGEAATLVACVLLVPALVLCDPREPGAAPVPRARAAARLVPIAVVAALLAAAAWVPALALLPLTPRGQGLPITETLKWPLLPGRLPELILPRLFGDPTRLPPTGWWGAWLFDGGYPFLPSIHLGAVTLVFALGAAGAGRERRRTRALLAVAVVGLGLAVLPATQAGAALAARFPAARLLRYPERFLLVTVAATALLAALGLERLLMRRGASRLPHAAVVLAALAFVLVSALAAAPAMADGVLGALGRLPASFVASDLMGIVRGGAMRSLLWLLAELSALAAASFIVARGSRAASRAAAWCLAAASAVSMLYASAPARSMAAAGWLEAPSPLRDAVSHGAGAPRLVHEPRPADLRVWGRTDEQIWGFRFDRFTYSLLTGHGDAVPTILDPATDRMDLAPSVRLGTALGQRPIADQVRLLRLCGAGSLLAWQPLDTPGLVAGPVLEGLSMPPARLYRVERPLPRIRFVSRQAPPRDPGDPLASLLDPAFDPESMVLVDGAVRADPPGPEARARLRVLQDDPERLRIEVETDRPGHLMVSDAEAPGWRARLDGEPVAIERANTMFRAVAVPPGRHELEMTYLPSSVMAGFALSLLGVAALLLAARRAARQARLEDTLADLEARAAA